jgi:hypothetical protein
MRPPTFAPTMRPALQTPPPAYTPTPAGASSRASINSASTAPPSYREPEPLFANLPAGDKEPPESEPEPRVVEAARGRIAPDRTKLKAGLWRGGFLITLVLLFVLTYVGVQTRSSGESDEEQYNALPNPNFINSTLVEQAGNATDAAWKLGSR